MRADPRTDTAILRWKLPDRFDWHPLFFVVHIETSSDGQQVESAAIAIKQQLQEYEQVLRGLKENTAYNATVLTVCSEGTSGPAGVKFITK